MAVAVEFRTYTPPDSRLDLVRRIESAPREHAEAVLEAYDVLQRLHDTGALALVNGLLSAEDTVIDKMTDVVSSKQAVAALRIAMVLGHRSMQIAFTQRSRKRRRKPLRFGDFFALPAAKRSGRPPVLVFRWHEYSALLF